MSVDSDVALLGTGVASLVAATTLLSQGKSVLLLNPDWDFFRENSELPLDPFWPVPNAEHLIGSSPEQALSELRPDFPGAVELWNPGGKAAPGYHDLHAPHVRSRSRLWIHSRASQLSALEELYVEASDLGLKPQLFEGVLAAGRFPGMARQTRASLEGDLKGLYVPKVCDVDVIRYRNGLLEFVRERLGSERVVCNATQIEMIPEGVRFRDTQGVIRTARLGLGLMAFWTPRLTAWISSQVQEHLKKAEELPPHPVGIRLWEEWSLISRDALDPGVVGVYEDMTVWAEVEGAPAEAGSDERLSRLAVLRPGPLLPLDSLHSDQPASWASTESFAALSRLLNDFLQWEKFSVRSMRPRAILEWKEDRIWGFSHGRVPVQIVPSCDGPLVDVVRTARRACEVLA